MRRKAKELQQARRDAERSGKKVPAFGGFGSAGMTSVSSGSIITDTIVEPEKPKIAPTSVRYQSRESLGKSLVVPPTQGILTKVESAGISVQSEHFNCSSNLYHCFD